MQQKLEKLQEETILKIRILKTEQEVIDYRNEINGKNGSLTEILKGIKDLSVEDKQTVGKFSNDIKNLILEEFEKKLKEIKNEEIKFKLENEFFDVTIPTDKDFGGHLHPLTRVLRQIEDTFKRMGFDIFESNEVTTEFWNFDSLNVPANHPARDMQDTFWLEGKGNVLSTQTSSMQNIIMKSEKLPIRAIIPGRVFRNEDIDATHENTFYQVEGIVIDENITLGNLKYTIRTMLADLFESEVEIRLRPGYFPFVEPGVEVDFSCPFCKGTGDNCRICKGTGWIEFMGAGLIHPNVLIQGGIDPEKYSGFAFGFGMNRLAMIKYGVPDMRYFQHPNVAFLKQF